MFGVFSCSDNLVEQIVIYQHLIGQKRKGDMFFEKIVNW